MTQPTQDPKNECPACKNGVEAKNTIVGEFNNLCDNHQADINGHLISLTTPATKPLDELLSNPDKSNTTKSGFEITFDPVHLRAEIQALITNAEKQAYLNGYTQAKAETMLENTR